MSEPPKTVGTFLRCVEEWGYRYLAAGDQAYTERGQSLYTMFTRFPSEEALLKDFFEWSLAKLKEGHP